MSHGRPGGFRSMPKPPKAGPKAALTGTCTAATVDDRLRGLAALELPLGTRVSPRGHVLAHRKAKDGESHIYQVSLGIEQGVDPEEPIEFRRVSAGTGWRVEA